VKELNHDEMNHSTQVSGVNIFMRDFISEGVHPRWVDRLAWNSKINIFIKNLSMKEFDYDEMNRLTRISMINIFIKNFISERVQP
jgi:hypothetical protein